MESLQTLDHNYSRHWSEVYKTDTSHARPIQWLMPSCKVKGSLKSPRSRGGQVKSSSSEGSDDEVDVESLDEVMSSSTSGSSWSYDVQRARLHMGETERHAFQNIAMGKHAAVGLRSESDWEEHLNKSTWSLVQTKVFTKLVKILEDEKLARLAYKGVNNEPIARRLSLDRSAAYFRRVMAEFAWDQKLAQWLHSLMINRLPPSMVASYLDLIQTLRSKVPTLVERMIMPSARETSSGAPDSLNLLLKRPWEPTLLKSSLQNKPRLPDPPVILMVPNSPYTSSPAMAHRRRLWGTCLNMIGKVVPITAPDATSSTTVLMYLEQLATVVRSKIKSLQKKHPERPVVLVGWHTASVLSCHVSLVEKVSAIVCLGFPMSTLNGPRGTVDDVLCDLSTPTLFVIGDEADSCDIDDLEDVREQLLTESQTSLLAVPGGDDALKVSDRVKRKACVTQPMVDKMIIDHIGKFLHTTLTMKEGTWELVNPVMDEEHHYLSTDKRSSDTPYRRRKHEVSEESVSEVKRRRLSSTTTAKISEVLSGQKRGSSRDGTNSPVQGVTFNLQTGSISGLTTVPTVLGRSKSITKEVSQATKHGKAGSKSKNQARSITIDLTKDTSSQLNAHYRAVPDKSLLATESQTEAAVATILGSGSVEKPPALPDVANESADAPVRSPETGFLPASSSAFTRLGTTNYLIGGNPGRSAIMAPAASTSAPAQGPPKVLPNLSMTIGGNMGQFSRQKKSFTNTKFSSTLISPKPITSENLSTINKQQWGVVGATDKTDATNRQATYKGKFGTFAPQSPAPTSHILSRSRKEERETLQATAILEKLTSSLGADDTGDLTTSIIREADSLSLRRHSCDSAFMQSGQRGRGRPRTRGGSSSAQSRQVAQKRRKTINEERPAPLASYHQKTKPQKNTDSCVRYVMAPDMSSVLSNAAAKAAAASSGKSFQKHSGITIIQSEKTFFPKTQSPKTSNKPSILPVYAISPTTSRPTQHDGDAKMHGGTSSSPHGRQPLSSSGSSSKSTASTALTQAPGTKGSHKVYVTQKVPVKFPGSIPGSNYTFVTIPALSGPTYNSANMAIKSTVVKKAQQPTAKPRAEPRVIKYSVVSRGAASVPHMVSSAQAKAPRTAVNLREKAQARVTVKSLPQAQAAAAKQAMGVNIKKTVFTSPSVVLRKLWSDTVANINKDSSGSPNTTKQNSST